MYAPLNDPLECLMIALHIFVVNDVRLKPAATRNIPIIKIIFVFAKPLSAAVLSMQSVNTNIQSANIAEVQSGILFQINIAKKKKKMIDIHKRIGILDRKLRVVNENAADETEWLKWTIRAFQSVYGYEYQGDNLLIARINLLMTFVDYMDNRWHRQPEKAELRKMANIISWNIWQMDGLKGTVPMGILKEEYHQMSLFEPFQEVEEVDDEPEVRCRIYDWRSRVSVPYSEL